MFSDWRRGGRNPRHRRHPAHRLFHLPNPDQLQARQVLLRPLRRPSQPNRVAIRPLKRTYVRVIVGDEKGKPAFERWVSPTDGPVEFRGKHVSIRVLDPDAVKITKNGKALEEDDEDVTIN